MSEIADVLDRAADLIEPKGAWTPWEYARTRPNGASVPVTSDEAKCFCGVGAIMREAGVSNVHLLPSGARGIANLLGFDSLFDFYIWNDAKDRTQAEVVAKLREAAAKARTPQYALKNGRV